MKFHSTPLAGLVVIEPAVYTDPRGYFFESYNLDEFRKHQIDVDFVQDNQSNSKKGVIRGIHFQRDPHAQGKLVRVITGSVYDVAVDLRPGSPTFGRYIGLELSASNLKMLWIPAGFGHGFSVLEDNTTFLYKVTAGYNRESEGGIRYDDTELNINWQVSDALVSEKDRILPTFQEFRQMLK